jgi:putative nucleotidyltransferase with HDIG domain
VTGLERCAVLFVDDDPRVLQGLRRMLHAERHNWTLQFAASGREAMACLGRDAFDAVVTDLRMPDMDGVELLTFVMEHHPSAARIVLSAEIDPAAGLQTVHCAHQFIAKPCEAGALKSALTRAFALRRLITDHRLKALLSRLHTLPSQPALYTQVVAEIQSPNSSFRKVGELVARDVGMTAKILQLVNSAFFGLPRRIQSPQEAVALLGCDTVKGLVLGVKIFSKFDSRQMKPFGLDTLWQHSLAASQCARTISSAEKLSRQAQAEAFTAGILHDVGKLILAQNFPDSYAGIVRRALMRERPLTELETECFGASHAELGAYLMGLWGLDEDVIDSIACHHCLPRTNPIPPVTTVVYAANALDHLLSTGPADAPAASLDAAVLAHLNIADRFAEWELSCRRLRQEEDGRAA